MLFIFVNSTHLHINYLNCVALLISRRTHGSSELDDLKELHLVVIKSLLAVLVLQFDLDWDVLSNLELGAWEVEGAGRLGRFDAHEAAHLLFKRNLEGYTR